MNEAMIDPRLPNPKGYRILLELPKASDTISGSIIVKAASMAKAEEAASVVGKVLAMGSDCYTDPRRFPNGPWCHVGEHVMIRAYSGTRFLVDGEEYRLINDDTVEATVDEPGHITRI
jgi:co-chaperonin GroES (HSP10)